MSKLTEYLVVAAVGYAFRAYVKRDKGLTDKDQGPTEESQPRIPFPMHLPPTFMERQMQRVSYKLEDKLAAFLYGEPNRRSYANPYFRSTGPARYNRFTDRSHYTRFGRRDSK